MILTYSYCTVSVAPVRREPTHRSEQVNQLLFGEKAEVLEIDDNNWARIRVDWDGYDGWCKAGQLNFISKKEYYKKTKALAYAHNSKLVFDESEQWMPLGCDLKGLKGGKIIVSNMVGKFKGRKLNVGKAVLNAETLKAAAMLYMNAPYHWGGRSIAGIDCSGLTQMAFKLCGRSIPRDAAQQAAEGETVDFLQHTTCGDLAFFDNSEGKITHVGILLSNNSIIHATDTSGRVVIDSIDQGGIISKSLKKRTHNLRLVKRYF